MKTERRHDLETNELAVRIADWIEKLKPYSGQLVGAAIVLVGIAVIGSIWASNSSAKQQAAWDEYAVAHDTTDPELENLRRLAENDEYAGTKMQEWAHITWADRQVLLASGEYLSTRDTALDRLRNVQGVYENLVSGSSDSVIQNRALYGLGRVYEMQNKLSQARLQYGMVQGDLQPLASQRVIRLDSPKTQEDCGWLATAELPRRTALPGAGGLGSLPNFEADVPEATPEGGSTGSDSTGLPSLEEILGSAGEDAEGEDRYATEDAEETSEESDTPAEGTTEEATPEETPETSEEVPAENEAAAEAAESEEQ